MYQKAQYSIARHKLQSGLHLSIMHRRRSKMMAGADAGWCSTFVMRSETLCIAEPFLLTAGNWYLRKQQVVMTIPRCFCLNLQSGENQTQAWGLSTSISGGYAPQVVPRGCLQTVALFEAERRPLPEWLPRKALHTFNWTQAYQKA